MGIVRHTLVRCLGLTLAVSMGGSLVPSQVSAQSSGGGWGAEGRIGNGTSAYLIRWFSPKWSLLLGGGASYQSTENDDSNLESTNHNVNALAMMRREWGTGRVRRYVGFGPSLSLTRNAQDVAVTGGGIAEQSSESAMFGGRGELGAFASITQRVDLGISASATAAHVKTKNEFVSGLNSSESTGMSLSIGNPQFVMRVRF